MNPSLQRIRKTHSTILFLSHDPRCWPNNWILALIAAVMLLYVNSICHAQSPTPSKPKLPSLVDLREQFDKYGLERWQQGARPTCSAFTVVGALEFAMARQQGHGTRLSV